MDTKDIVDDEMNNNVDVTTSSDDQPDSNTTNTNTSSGLEQIEDNDSELPLPMGMAEVISNRAEPPKQKIGKVEQIDDDDLGPKPPTAMLEASFNAADIANKITASSKRTVNKLGSSLSAALPVGASDMNMNSSSEFTVDLTEALQSGRINLKEVEDIINSFKDTPTNAMEHIEHINELNPPVPYSANYEEDAIAKKKAKDEMMNQKPAAVAVLPPSDRDSIYEPPREIIEGSEGSDNTNTGRRGTNRRGWDDIGSGSGGSGSNNNANNNQVTEPNNDEENNDTEMNDGGYITAHHNNDTALQPIGDNSLERESTVHVPEAWAVDDYDNSDEVEVFLAKPLQPWWEQQQTRLNSWALLCLFSILSLVAHETDDQNIKSTGNILATSGIAISIFVSALASLAYVMSNTSFSRRFVGTKIEGLASLVIMAMWTLTFWAIMDPSNGIAQMYVGQSGGDVSDYQQIVANANLFVFGWLSLLCALRVFGMFVWDLWGKSGGMGFSYTSKWLLLVIANIIIIVETERFKNQVCSIDYGTDEANCLMNTIGLVAGKWPSCFHSSYL